MLVASIRVVMGFGRVVHAQFDNFKDAHTVAKVMSDGCPFEVEVWQGSVRTHVYHEGSAVKAYETMIQ